MQKTPKYIETFYSSLDRLEVINPWEQNKLLSSINRRIGRQWLSIIIAERKAIAYNLSNGRLVYHAQMIDNGKPINVELSRKDIAYLDNRVDATKSLVMMSRYAHILWQHTNHNKYAEIAIKCYVEHFVSFQKDDVDYILEILAAAYNISSKTHIGEDAVKKLIAECLKVFPISHCSLIIKTFIESKFFTQQELKVISKNYISRLSDSNGQENLTNKINLEICLRLIQKADLSTNMVYKLLAENEDRFIKSIKDYKDFARFDAVKRKAEYYKLAKMPDNSKSAFKEYTDLKNTVELSFFEHKLSPEIHNIINDYIIYMSKELLKRTPDEIFSYFSVTEDILVNPDSIDKVEKGNIIESICDIFSLTVFDINSNSKQLKEEEKVKYFKSKNYQALISLKFFPLFLRVFIDGINSGKITYYSLYNFLEKHTWYNTKFNISLANKPNDLAPSWLALIGPGIHNFFTQFEYSTLWRTQKVHSYILSIDSLTLKIEGILRDFIRLGGGITTQIKDNKPQEILLEKLIDHEIIEKFFSISEIKFFKHLFTKEGLNLRNDVAHSFMHVNNYSVQTAAMVFLCLLRIGKYNLVKSENENK